MALVFDPEPDPDEEFHPIVNAPNPFFLKSSA